MATRPKTSDRSRRRGGQQTTTRLIPEVQEGPIREPACVVVVSGPQLGIEAQIDDTPLLIGRADDCGLTLADSSVSRRHCRVFRDRTEFVVEDLGSTNGCAVNGTRVSRSRLRDGDRLRVGHCELKFFGAGSAEAGYHRELMSRAVFDALTGFYNRRQFREMLEHAFDHGRGESGQLRLMILDLDHFKPVNDRHGHLAGDSVLQGFADLVRSVLDPGIVAGRLGGEEFALFSRVHNRRSFAQLAETLRLALQDTALPIEGGLVAITVSIGIAAQQPEMRSAADLLRHADAVLYRAKLGGRNRVVESD